jgi:peptide/nickel transport system permease protein
MTQTSIAETRLNPKARRRRKWNVLHPPFRDAKSTAGVVLFLLFVLVALLAPVIAPFNPQYTGFASLEAPSMQHIMGTTYMGQDVFSQFVYGDRTTLLVGVGSGLVSTLISLAVGLTAGYYKGRIDSVLNMITNIFLVMPGLALLIVIESLVKNSTPLMNGVIIGLTGWAWGARVFRSQTMSLASRDFVLAAKLSGASDFRIMFTEIAPNMVSVIASNVMYACLGGILAESGLAFLGLENVQTISWGTMLYWASQNSAIISGAWWWFVPPGLGIAFVGLSLVFMNYAIDQITNPRLRVQKRWKVHAKC